MRTIGLYCITVLVAGFGSGTLVGCRSGRAFSAIDSGGDGFSYSIPETTIEVSLPVRAIVKKFKEGSEDGQRTEVLVTASDEGEGVFGIRFDGHPSQFRIGFDNSFLNSSQINEFKVEYFTNGTTDSETSSNIIKSINADSEDKVVETTKSIFTALGNVIKFAVALKSGRQSATPEEREYVRETVVEDRIRVSAPLRLGVKNINSLLDQECRRIWSRLGVDDDSVEWHGLSGLSFNSTSTGWPQQMSREFVQQKLNTTSFVENSETSTDESTSNIRLYNGIVYSRPQRATLTLNVWSTNGSDAPERTNLRRVEVDALIPEAGSFGLLPVNPGRFGKSATTASFGRNGGLLKWSLNSTAPSDGMAKVVNAQAEAAQLLLAEKLARDTAKRVEKEGAISEIGTLNVQIVEKESALRLATMEAELAKRALPLAKEETEKLEARKALVQLQGVEARTIEELKNLKNKRNTLQDKLSRLD